MRTCPEMDWHPILDIPRITSAQSARMMMLSCLRKYHLCGWLCLNSTGITTILNDIKFPSQLDFCLAEIRWNFVLFSLPEVPRQVPTINTYQAT